MLLQTLAVLVGLGLLTYGADRFVDGAAALARNLGVSTLIIGLTIVGFATSAPEMLVAATASVSGSPGLAIGNALGSNITNIALVLGATALLVPLAVHSGILRREYPIMFAAMLLVLCLLLDGVLSRVDGLIMVVVMVSIILFLIILSKRSAGDPLTEEFEIEMPAPMPTARSILLIFIGLLLLLCGSQSLVWGGSAIARSLGVSELVIGLTIVAVGTSLPELAASVVGVRKGEADLAIGNVIGSNLFNILMVMAMPALLAPGPFEPAVLLRDYPIMMALSVALIVMSAGLFGRGRSVSRIEGAVLLCCFVAYQGLLFYSA